MIVVGAVATTSRSAKLVVVEVFFVIVSGVVVVALVVFVVFVVVVVAAVDVFPNRSNSLPFLLYFSIRLVWQVRERVDEMIESSCSLFIRK